jgi:MFS family permease
MTIGMKDSEAISVQSAVRGFLGWQIVLVAFTAQLVASGVTLSAVGNFVIPISEEFGVSKSVIGIAPAIAILVIGILGPLLGRFLDRGWTRRLMMTGSALTGGGLILLSQATSVWHLGLVYGGLVCTGGALFGALPVMTLIANWFVKRRGLMLGVAYVGATLASGVGPYFAQSVIDADGWRTAVRYLGLFTWIATLPIFAAFVVSRPEDVGQLPDGDKPTTSEGNVGPVELGGAKTAQELARDPLLWLISVGFGLVMTSPVVILGLLIPFGMSLGFTGMEANYFLYAMVPFSIFGKIFIGGLADVAPLKPSIALIVVANIAVWAILYSDPSYPVFVAAGALYGIGIGGAAPVHGVVVGRCFGRANFGTAGGLGGLASIPLMVFAQILSQVLEARTGSYHVSFIVQGGLLLLAGLILGFVRIPPVAGQSA